MIAASLLSQLQQAKNSLEDAQIAFCGAVTAHAESKRTLELAEALKLCEGEGVEGKNEKERAAKLRLELDAEYAIMAEAADALTEGRCALNLARLDWELV